MATGDKLILSVATVFLYYNRGASVQGWSSATFWGLGSGQMGPYKGRAYASTVPRYGRCVEPGDSFSSLDFLHGWWSEMPIPLNERNNERDCRRRGDVREWEGPQTCPAHMGPDTPEPARPSWRDNATRFPNWNSICNNLGRAIPHCELREK